MPLAENRSGQQFVRAQESWSELSDNIYVWDYSINFDYFLSPFPNVKDNIKARCLKIDISGVNTCPEWPYGVGYSSVADSIRSIVFKKQFLFIFQKTIKLQFRS